MYDRLDGAFHNVEFNDDHEATRLSFQTISQAIDVRPWFCDQPWTPR